MSSYPPGVSGNEIQITGPLEEWTQDIGCPVCERESRLSDCWWHPDTGAWACCRWCWNDIQLPDPDEIDPDEAYELARDLRWEREHDE